MVPDIDDFCTLCHARIKRSMVEVATQTAFPSIICHQAATADFWQGKILCNYHIFQLLLIAVPYLHMYINC